MNETLPSRYELYFRSLLLGGRGLSFPCDSRGRVDLDALSERARNDYFYARAMVGRQLAPPSVESRTWVHTSCSASVPAAAR